MIKNTNDDVDARGRTDVVRVGDRISAQSPSR